MSNVSLAAPAPSISDHIEAPNDKRRCATSALAERLRDASREEQEDEEGSDDCRRGDQQDEIPKAGVILTFQETLQRII